MQTYEQYNGIFLPNDSQFVGHLKIEGPNSTLKLVGKSDWKQPEAGDFDIHGTLSDGRKASLLRCVINSSTEYHFDNSSQCEITIFPNYVIVGQEFIHSEDLVIKAIHYHFENINSLVSGHEIFRSLRPDNEEVARILETDHKRLERMAEEHDWPKRPFKPQIGEHPHLLYFSGQWEILSIQINSGKVSLTNRTTHSPGGARGIGIKNEVTINIEFSEAKILDDSIDTLHTLHRLFEISLGYRQRYRWIELELARRSKIATHDLPQKASLYWSLCNERVETDTKGSLNNVLFSPDRHPEEFSKVAAEWMNSTDSMGEPRVRFATAFFGNYSIDRIVGAANMFDLLPERLSPGTKKINVELKNAVAECRKIFEALPDSFAKQSVLSSMGRIGKASLRDKIYHRADTIIAVAKENFPDLYLPCHHAVAARNHYVHGSTRSFDYQQNFPEFAFITDTLEFVFAASDLLDLGWDLKRWMREGLSMTHPLGAYVINYPDNIRRLQALIAK